MLRVVATSVDGRVAKRRIPLVAAKRVVPKPKPPVTPPLAILSQSVSDGQQVAGLLLWRVEVSGKPSRVEFVIDGVVRGTDVAAPYTFGWNSDAETPGTHHLTARAVGKQTAEATTTVIVAPR